MAYFGKKLKYNIEPGEIIKIGEGENTFLTPFEIKKSESVYSRNLSSKNFPAMSVRDGKVRSFGTGTSAIATPNGLSAYNNTYPHIVDGTDWKRRDGSAWQTVASSLANTTAKFLEFNTESKRYMVMVNGTDKKAWDGSSVTDLTDGPATKLYVVDDYRLYGLVGSVLKCSAEGSVTDWTTAGDADSIAITGMVGVGTAIAALNDNVFCWSDQTMHVLMGNDYEDWTFSDPMGVGCISDRSVLVHGRNLYFLDYGKYCILDGFTPIEISQKVKTYLEAIPATYKALCCAGKSGKYIYLSIPYGAVRNNNLTLEFDTELGLWYPHDIGFLDFVNIGDYLYGIDTSGVIWRVNSGTDDGGTAISWNWTSGCWMEGAIREKKVISDFWIVADLPVASTMQMYYSTSVDNDDFVELYEFTGNANEQNTRVQVPTTALQNINWYRIRFTGTGPCTIHYVNPILRVKAR